MELRSLLKSGQGVALGVLALGAVQSGLTMAGGDSRPVGWNPMPGPADGGVGSPPFPLNLTDEERVNRETFDALDFEVIGLTPLAAQRCCLPRGARPRGVR